MSEIEINSSRSAAFGAGTLIGALGGLIGLGGAEFRLPLLICWFRMPTATSYRVVAVLLVVIAAVLLTAHDVVAGSPLLEGWMQLAAGIAAGFGIGVVASLLGVAGGSF